ncbi:MAG: Signal transduction histidine kinase CheA [Proteobacteria bacterium]|nr:Signal transduction histidine kinase CheA [Pseudomonadota bacterium]
MSFDLQQFHQIFFDEAKENLEEMERQLLTLDLLNPDQEEVNAVFRAAHSIKGGAATFGFQDMADITHVLESLLDKVRHGELPFTSAIIDAALQAGDILSRQLRGHRDGAETSEEEAIPVITKLKALAEGKLDSTVIQQTPLVAAPPNSSGHQIRITLLAGATTPAQRDTLRFEFEPHDPALWVDAEDGSSSITLHTCSMPSDIEEILSFVVSPEHYCLETLPPLEESRPEPVAEATENLLEGEGFGFFVDPAQLKAQAEEDQGFGFFVDLPSPDTATPTPSPHPVPASPENNAGAEPGEHPRRRASDREADTSIRVSVDKVDQLVNLVGELVITHAMLAQTISRMDPVLHESLFSGMGQLDRNSRDLQEAVMSIRMLPIGSVFSRFPRMVRDIAAKLGKEVELKTIGESTELDKGLIERLSDPLTHLVRNSLDHGIEDPEQRELAGKPRKGTLTLQAYHQGGSITIEVLDDGAGLNREKILAKAASNNLQVSPDAPDHEVWQLIFAPGLSTAEEITDVSGRGVGMDVVKRNIEGMGGRVEISSQAGAGTRISIRLPLTLAILDGMSIGVGSQTFIIPLNMIVESLQPKRSEVSTVSSNGRVVHVRGEYLPVVALHEVFSIVPVTTDPCEGIVVILELEGSKVALFVDALLGQHQVVIKSLETNYRKVRGVSGATIMGDGHVGLILDVPALIQLSRS